MLGLLVGINYFFSQLEMWFCVIHMGVYYNLKQSESLYVRVECRNIARVCKYHQIFLLLVISRVCAAFDKFKAWESDPSICFPDLPEKLPHLEVYEHASTDKSKQQPGLRWGLSRSPGPALHAFCFSASLPLKTICRLIVLKSSQSQPTSPAWKHICKCFWHRRNNISKDQI